MTKPETRNARLAWYAGLVGLAAGTAFSLSPAGVAALAVLAGLVWWTVSDLRGTERRWVTAWLLAAVAARILVVAALSVAVDPRQQSFRTVFGGDASYMIERSIWIRNAFVGDPFAPRDLFEAFQTWYGWSGYTYALALLHVFFGPSPYATHVVSIVLFVAAVALLFRCVRSSFGRVAAFVGVALLTTMPSLFVWSVAPLKEAPIIILAAVAIRAMLSLLRPGRWWHAPVAALAIVIALVSIHLIRPESAQLTAAALAAGAVGWFALRTRRGAIVVVLVVLAATVGVVTSSRATAAMAGVVREAARRHIGSVGSAGHSFGLLDADAYGSGAGGEGRLDAGAMTRFFIRATVRFFSAPEPWILKPGVELALIPQQMIWYALVGLAVVGAIAGCRRDPLLTALLSGFVIVGAAGIGMNSGNIGTFIRHRDAVVPCVIWLAAMGSTYSLGVPTTRRVNPLDGGVAAIALVLIPAGFGLFLLFRMPALRIDAVEPTVVSAPGELVLRGEHLRPFLRAYVSSRGPHIQLADNLGAGAFPEAAYYARNGREAIVKLPALAPGAYDLGVYDGSDEVAYMRRGFAVVVPDAARRSLQGGATRYAIVDYVGWPGAQAQLAPGARDAGRPFDAPSRPSEIVRIITVEPFVGDATLDGVGPGDRLSLQQPLVRIRAVVRFPLLPSGQAEQRGKVVSLGSMVEFETAQSLLRGTITGFVDPPATTHP